MGTKDEITYKVHVYTKSREGWSENPQTLEVHITPLKENSMNFTDQPPETPEDAELLYDALEAVEEAKRDPSSVRPWTEVRAELTPEVQLLREKLSDLTHRSVHNRLSTLEVYLLKNLESWAVLGVQPHELELVEQREVGSLTTRWYLRPIRLQDRGDLT